MIETARLILRPWRDCDLAPFAALNADPAIMGTHPGVMTRGETRDLMEQYLALWVEDGFSYGAMIRKSDSAFLGLAGITRCPLDQDATAGGEIGWALARPFWGQGYATEAALAWLAHGFDDLLLPEVIALADPTNRRSQAVMRRIGLRPDPRRAKLDSSRPRELHVLTRAEWLDQRAAR